jgi:hypothetical protein
MWARNTRLNWAMIEKPQDGATSVIDNEYGLPQRCSVATWRAIDVAKHASPDHPASLVWSEHTSATGPDSRGPVPGQADLQPGAAGVLAISKWPSS